MTYGIHKLLICILTAHLKVKCVRTTFEFRNPHTWMNFLLQTSLDIYIYQEAKYVMYCPYTLCTVGVK